MSMPNPWTHYRSFTRETDVTRRLKPGTTRRIVGFARPYRGSIAAFLVTVVLDALTVVVTPLLFKVIIDDGVSAGNKSVVIWTAVALAAVAVADTDRDAGRAVLLLADR